MNNSLTRIIIEHLDFRTFQVKLLEKQTGFQVNFTMENTDLHFPEIDLYYLKEDMDYVITVIGKHCFTVDTNNCFEETKTLNFKATNGN